MNQQQCQIYLIMQRLTLTVILFLLGCAQPQRQLPSLDKISFLLEESFSQSLLLQCFKCETGSWPKFVGEVLAYTPSSSICVGIKQSIMGKSQFNMFELYATTSVEVLDENQLKLTITEEVTDTGIVQLERPISLSLGIDIENMCEIYSQAI